MDVKIEIHTSTKYGTTVSGLQTDISGLINSSDNLITTLNSIKNATFFINGGVGTLQNALNCIDHRISLEEDKKTNLERMQSKTSSFINLAQSADCSVSEIVDKNKNEFYRVNRWSKPSILTEATFAWYSNARKWLTNVKKVILDEFSHNWQIATETNFTELTEEELNSYCNDLRQRISENGLSNDDEVRTQVLLEFLSKGSFGDKTLYYDIYSILNSDKLSFIEDTIRGKDYTSFKASWIKYFMTKGTSLSGSESLYEKWTNTNNYIMDLSMCDVDDKKLGFEQGNFFINELQISEKTDGSCKFSFAAKQSSGVFKSNGAAIVYDADGKVINIKVLERYKNPTSLSESFKQLIPELKGENYQITEVSLEIPKGGYIQITDDPDEISIVQTGMILQESVEDQIKDTLKDEVGDWIEKEIRIENPGKHATDSAKLFSSTFVQAKEGFEFAMDVAGFVDKLETVIFTPRQRGSGSTIIYND